MLLLAPLALFALPLLDAAPQAAASGGWTQDLYYWFKDHMNYPTITVLMAIESSFIPFPSEVVIPPAAYFAARNGDMNIIMIVVIATLGALIGAVINYVLSLLIGRPVVYAFANSRFGHMCLIDAENLNVSQWNLHMSVKESITYVNKSPPCHNDIFIYIKTVIKPYGID